MKQTNVESLKTNALLLDGAMGNIRNQVDTLQAVASEFMQLQQDMENTPRENVAFKFYEWRRMVKILSELLRMTVEETDIESTGAHNLHEVMFNQIVELDQPQKVVSFMSPERDREVSFQQNRKMFINNFGREPESGQEVCDWVAELVSAIDKQAEKKPSPLATERHDQ